MSCRSNIPELFAQRWGSVLQEYAVRYGDKVKGWWVDADEALGGARPRLSGLVAFAPCTHRTWLCRRRRAQVWLSVPERHRDVRSPQAALSSLLRLTALAREQAAELPLL